MPTIHHLLGKKCKHTEQGFDEAQIKEHLALVPDWQMDGGKLVRTYAFQNYYETLAFVNAIAFVIHINDHHPELVVTYNRCQVKFDTHSVNGGKGGISENDFICAAKLDALFKEGGADAV